jgi:hypothetical protein
MATTTTNYGFDIPQSTDLVKDGATAIATLGQDIDTAMNTALGTKKAGMVLLNTTSFSGVTSQSISDVFSATYDNYKVMFWWKGASASGTVTFRYRVAGADNSTSNYARQFTGSASTTVFAARNDSQTSFSLDLLQTNTAYRVSEIFNPFKTEFTTSLSQQYYRADQNQSSEYLVRGDIFQATTSFTGFSILSSGANMEGQIQVFGYNK